MLFRLLIIAVCLIAPLIAVGPAAAQDAATPPGLEQARVAVQAALDRLNRDMAAVVAVLAKTGITGREARNAMVDLPLTDHPGVVDYAAINPQGIITVVQPGQYSNYEGGDVSYQEQVKQVIKTGQPVLSAMFDSVEGYPAVDLELPIIDATGKYLGSLSALIRPAKMFRPILKPLHLEKDLKFYVLQLDGYMLYSDEPREVGRNLFKDKPFTEFPGVMELGKQLAAKKKGAFGPYAFLGDGFSKKEKKLNWWTSVGLHQTTWRLGCSVAVN